MRYKKEPNKNRRAVKRSARWRGLVWDTSPEVSCTTAVGGEKEQNVSGFPRCLLKEVTASSVPTFLRLLPIAVEGSHAWDVSPAGIILIGDP